MGTDEQQIKQYEQKICGCETMTDLLVAMSAWQSFAEARLITQVKPSLW